MRPAVELQGSGRGRALAGALAFVSLEGRGTPHAVGYMLLGVVAFSLVPLMVHLGGGAGYPLLMNAGLRVGICLYSVALLTSVRRYRVIFLDPRVLGAALRGLPSWSSLFILLNQFEYAAFALASRDLDIAVVTVLFEAWPVAFIMLVSVVLRGRYRRVGWLTLLLVCVSLGGVVLVVASQRGCLVCGGEASGLELLRGLGFAVTSLVFASFGVFYFRWVSDCANRVAGESGRDDLEVVLSLESFMLVSVVSVPAGLGLGLLLGEPLALGGALWSTLAFGAVGFCAILFWRKANLVTGDSAVNALCYLIPLVALLWLTPIGASDVARLDLLLVGGVLVVLANVALYFESRLGR